MPIANLPSSTSGPFPNPKNAGATSPPEEVPLLAQDGVTPLISQDGITPLIAE